MKIGIIGAGSIGGTLARRLAEIGHDVFIANSRGPETLRDLAAQTGATAVTVEQAARDAGVVIVSIPERNIEELPKDLFSGIPDSVVVVDTGNYYPRQRDGRIEAIEAGMPESVWVAAALGRPVIKAFNVMYAERLGSLGKPKGTPARVAIPVAGDDARAKGIVMNLVDELGFDPIDAGTLGESWRQQPGTPLYLQDLDAGGVRDALARASQQRAPYWTATAKSPGTFQSPQ